MERQRMERRTFSCSRAGGALWLRLALLIATLLPFSVRVFAATPPLVPDTPAGHILQLWLDAFDSGDAGKLASYKQHYDPSDSFATSAAFQQQTGGFDLVAIEKSEPLRVSFRVKERLSQSLAFGVLALDAGASAAVKSLDLTLIPPNATIEDVALDAGERHRVITGITAQLKDGYIYAPVADQMAQMLATNEKAGAYDTVVDGSAFATLLTQQIAGSQP